MTRRTSGNHSSHQKPVRRCATGYHRHRSVAQTSDGGGIGGENDNDAEMFFLTQRLETLRQQINPDAGIILAHHTRKMPKRGLKKTRSEVLSGAGSLRRIIHPAWCCTVLMMHGQNVHCISNCAMGAEIPAKTIQRNSGGWQEVTDQSERLVMGDGTAVPDVERLRKKEVIVRPIYQVSVEFRSSPGQTSLQRPTKQAGRKQPCDTRPPEWVHQRVCEVFSQCGCLRFTARPAGSRQGYLCVEDMTLGQDQRVLPTHFKHPQTGDIIPVDDPQIWVTAAAAYEEEAVSLNRLCHLNWGCRLSN